MTDVNINVEVPLNELVDDIFHSCSHEEMIQFIIDLDLRVAEYDFTSELIKRLSKSLEPDAKSELQELEKKYKELKEKYSELEDLYDVALEQEGHLSESGLL